MPQWENNNRLIRNQKVLHPEDFPVAENWSLQNTDTAGSIHKWYIYRKLHRINDDTFFFAKQQCIFYHIYY